MLRISAHDRRALIAAAATVTAIASASRLVPRAITWNVSSRRSAAALVARAASEEASVQALSRTRDSLVARDVRMMGMDSLILQGDTPPLAGATLAELVSDVAERSKALLGNVEIRMDSSSRAVFLKVSAQTTVTGDLSAITRFIAGLESAPTLLIVRDLGIHGQLSQNPDNREALRADVLIEGLTWNRLSGRGIGR